MTEIFIAIDTPDISRAAALVRDLSVLPLHIKLGLEFFTAAGPAGVAAVKKEMRNGANLFLDLKLYDIPNTVAGAVKSAGNLGVDFLTVHAAGGIEMMQAAQQAAGHIKLLAVTVLTSLQDAGTENTVIKRAHMAKDAGIFGVVCSPHEIVMIKKETGMPVVVPGIRPLGSDGGDQKRTMMPQDAAKAGADYLVIGRPITQAANPVAAARDILATI